MDISEVHTGTKTLILNIDTGTQEPTQPVVLPLVFVRVVCQFGLFRLGSLGQCLTTTTVEDFGKRKLTCCLHWFSTLPSPLLANVAIARCCLERE